MSRSFHHRAMLLGLLLVVCLSSSSRATRPYYWTRPAYLLQKSTQVLIQDHPTSMALYRRSDSTMIHRFVAKDRFRHVAVSADEQWLAIACGDGGFGVWNVQQGNSCWWKSADQSSLRYPYDVSFSGDGQSVAVNGANGSVLIFGTKTGTLRQEITPIGRQTVRCAALSPDGSAGALIDTQGQLFSFNVATGTVKDLELTATSPIRYSADGKYIACGDSDRSPNTRLRVICVADGFASQDFGRFGGISKVEPTADGSFLVTTGTPAPVGRGVTGYEGLQFQPSSGEFTKLWIAPAFTMHPNNKDQILFNCPTDYSADPLIGVYTDRHLKTMLIDLQTRAVIQTIDNSANDEGDSFIPSSDSSWLGWLVVVMICLVLPCGAMVVFYRRRR